jgi:dUTPase
MSLLSGEEIKQLGLVEGAKEELYRASTYDLSIEEIIPSGGVIPEGSKFPLSSGGMVRVISKECLKLPDTVTGHVLLKNELCTQGVLAISIGVVDPGFEGPISSTLINFGRETCEINKGDAFLRVSFFRCQQSSKATHSQKNSRDGYVRKVRRDVLAYSGPTFLNMDKMAARAATRAFGSFRNWLVIWAGLIAVLVAVIAIFAPLGAAFVDKHLVSDEQRDIRLEQAIEKDVEARDEIRLKALTEQVEELKRNADKSKPTGSNATK